MIFARKFLALLVLVAVLLTSVNAFADGEMSITVSPDTESETKVDVAGVAAADSILMLQVLYNKSEMPLPELTPDVTEQMLYYADSIVTDDNGEFAFDDIDMGEVSGLYIFRANYKNGEEALEYAYKYRSPFYVSEIIGYINSAIRNNDSSELERLIVNEKDAVNPDSAYLQKISDKELLADLCNTFLKLGEVSDKADFQKQFLQAVLLTYFNNVTDKAELNQVLSDCAEAADFGNKSFYAQTFLKTLSEDVVDMVIDSMCESAPYEDIKLFNDAFMSKVILLGINEGSWGVVQSILEENGEALSENVADEYASLKSKTTKYSNVAKALVDKNFKSVSELVTAWEDAIDEEKDSGSSSGSGSSGGSGGGGSRGSGGSNMNWEIPVDSTDSSQSQPSPYFDDIAHTDWAVGAINKLAEAGIVKGKSPRKFCPDDYITRSEFLSILINALGLADDTAECNFDDVSAESWFYSSVASAHKLGIAQGIGNGLFGAEQKISRQDLCVLVYRAMKTKNSAVNVSGSAQFADSAEIAAYAVEAVNALSGYGIVNGVGNGRFDPYGTATRAQAAKIISLAIDNVR